METNNEREFVIKYISTKHNNVDRICVYYEKNMNTTAYKTIYGEFTMQNIGAAARVAYFNEAQSRVVLCILKRNLRAGFGKYIIESV